MKVEYKAGVCNIGPLERQKRFITGVMGLIIALGSWILLKSTLALIVFSIAGFIGLIQARTSFCVAHGFMNTANLDTGEKKLLASEATKNKIQATKIVLLAIGAGLIFSLVISMLIK